MIEIRVSLLYANWGNFETLVILKETERRGRKKLHVFPLSDGNMRESLGEGERTMFGFVLTYCICIIATIATFAVFYSTCIVTARRAVGRTACWQPILWAKRDKSKERLC